MYSSRLGPKKNEDLLLSSSFFYLEFYLKQTKPSRRRRVLNPRQPPK